jgi:hypothetical protein
VRRLFEPLGYHVVAEHHPLDEKFPEGATGRTTPWRSPSRLRCGTC